MSQGFLATMGPMVFKFTDTFETFSTLAKNLQKKVGKDKFEAVHINNSGHLEQMDRAIYEEWTMAYASPSMSGVSVEKKEGSNV